MTLWLTREYSWRKGLLTGAVALATTLLQFILRLQMRFWIIAVMICLAVLLLIRLISERRLLAGNIAGVIMVVSLTLFLPQMTAAIYARRKATMPPAPKTAISDPSEASRLWAQIAIRRHISIEQAKPGSSYIDTEVEFHTLGDIIRYLPRAAEIGFLAPFPKFWFVRGEKVGLAGRLLSGSEMFMLYAVEVLALVGLIQNRRYLAVWLLALIGAIGVIGLGLVVVNLGTLYRMRYPFSILLVILAATVLSRRRSGEALAADPEPVGSIQATL
jgi:hypothetical protein